MHAELNPTSGRSTTPASKTLRGNWHRRLARRVLDRLEHLPKGTLTVIEPDGHERTFQGAQPGPDASITLHTYRALRRMLTGGDLAFAEAYIDGDWDTPDLQAVLLLGAVNEQALLEVFEPGLLNRAIARLRHLLRRNTVAGARKNIVAHYDLGNDFYRLWLDESMTYSCADFQHSTQTLADAQVRKLESIAVALDTNPGGKILEIGCGWGALACHLAERHAVAVYGITLSDEQLRFAQQRVADRGVSDRVELEIRDYRAVTERYDGIVSVEMLEAVGEAYWPTYFAQLYARLKPGGRAVVQVIVINDEFYDYYRAGADFIQTHIFPGGMLPSPGVMQQLSSDAGLVEVQRRALGTDYARTLELWDEQFLNVTAELEALGYDAKFQRLWRYYFGYCRAGFLAGKIDLLQVTWQRPLAN